MTAPYFSRIKHPGVVTGLATEAGCFPTHITRLHGVGLAAARTNSQILVRQQHDLLISAGLAGGLDPDLTCGCLIIGTSILSGEKDDHARIECDPEIAQTLISRMTQIPGEEIAIRQGVILSTPGIITRPEDKSRLYRQTGAVAVDMESYAVGTIAREAGKPVAVLRVITDTADQIVPPSAQAALSSSSSTGHSGIQIVPLLETLIRQPGEITDLIRLAKQTRKALKTLRRCGVILAD